MSKQWTIENDTGAELTVRAPNGFAVELDANSADPRERFAYFAIRQQARDIASRDAVIVACAKAVGASVSPECSDEFRAMLPGEIRALVDQLRTDLAAAVAERDRLTRSIEDDFSGWRAVERRWKARAEQAEARLAVIDGASGTTFTETAHGAGIRFSDIENHEN